MNSIRIAVIGVIALSLAASPTILAQYGGDYQTNIISGVTSNWTGNYLVGSTNLADVLLIQNSGVLYTADGYVGLDEGSSSNKVSVTGSGSVWDLGTNSLYVGYYGPDNSLVISNGGQVIANYSDVSVQTSSSNNTVLVTGADSAWRTAGLDFGNFGSSNRLVISNGGQVLDNYGGLGGQATSSNHYVLVTDNGSVWSNEYDLYVGNYGSSNRLVINNGGKVFASYSSMGEGALSSDNTVLVTGSDSVWSNFTLYVGIYGPGNSLVISNGGGVVDYFGYIGYDGSSNSVLVSGTGSVWSNDGSLTIGLSGAGNQLIITDGGKVNDNYVRLGSNSSSTNNMVLVSGAGSVWSNRSLYVGLSGAGNSLVVSNGGRLVSNSGTLGQMSTSWGNAVLVTGTGSVWSNSTFVWLGNYGSSNSLVINNGGQVINRASGHIGYSSNTCNNSALVSGAGSVWSISSGLYVGSGGSTNRLTVDTGGSVIASNVYIGFNTNSVGNQITVNDGELYATNVLGNGVLDVRRGTLTFNGGTVAIDQLVMTNGSQSVFNFNGGVLNSGGTFVTNSQMFVVGNGSNGATFHLSGGVHSFANDLRIRTNASLTGCGTITGNVLVEGTVLADCGTTIDFNNVVTNNGTVTAASGTVLKFHGPVVNNGFIDATGGDVQFLSTISNNGVILTPTNSWTDGSGKWETATNWSHATAPASTDAANLITNAGNNTVTIDATTTGNFPSTLTINNLTVSAPGVAANTLFLDNAGTMTPLRVLDVLLLGTNGAMVVNNSAVQAINSIHIGDSSASSSLVVSNGGSVIVTNGGGTGSVVVNGGSLVLGEGTFKTDNLIITNGGAVQHTQTYRVDNTTVTVAGGSEQAGSNLVAGSSVNSTGIVTVTDGGQLVVTNGVVGIGNSGTITGGGGVGRITVSNGTLLASTILLGSSAGGRGDLIVANGGTVRCPDGTNCLVLVNSLGTEVDEDGTFACTDGTARYGITAPADHCQSGGLTIFGNLYVGFSDSATLTVAGGVLHVSSHLIVGNLGIPLTTGVIWIKGGQLTVDDYSIIGSSGIGQMTISNGIVTAADLIVGNSSNPGTLTLAGGTLTANGIVLPNPSSRFIFSDGWLSTKAITNANGQTATAGNGSTAAMLDLLGGISIFDKALTISAIATLSGVGTVSGGVINHGLISPNGGALTFTGGAVTNYGTIVAPAGSSINFNGPVVNYGVIVTNNAVHFTPGGLTNYGTLLDAAADSDGDGMNNADEALAGTNPLNSSSVFRILAIAREGNDLRVTWSAVGGKHYVVQTSLGANGCYSNSFTDLGAMIPAAGTCESSASCLHCGAANATARYYRVRLVP